MSNHPAGRLVVVERPDWSPHRMWLRCLVSESDAYNIYWIQERKTGAGRGMSPRWLGFEQRDADVMRRLVACWNALLLFRTDQIEATTFPLAESLVTERDELIAALRECVSAIQSEFDAMGDDWKDQPMMRRKDKTLTKARALLAKHAPEGPTAALQPKGKA